MFANKTFEITEGRFGETFIPCKNEVPTREKYWAEANYLPEYEQVPLTIECWVKICESGYEKDMFISSGPKHYKKHWEIYTARGSNELCAYVPGLHSAPISTGFILQPDKWYYVAMVLLDEYIRLYVNKEEVAVVMCDAEVKKTEEVVNSFDNGVTIGGDDGMISCNGLIDEVRISKIAKVIDSIPEEAFYVEENTIALWNFDKKDDNGNYRDMSSNYNTIFISGPQNISLNLIEKGRFNAAGSVMESEYIEVPLVSSVENLPEGLREIFLDGNWEMAESGCMFSNDERVLTKWTDSVPAKVPGSVHTALLENELIPNPEFGHNAAIAKSKSHTTWWFKKCFLLPKDLRNAQLYFDGVSPDCEVWLNNEKLGSHIGAFGGPIFDISDLLMEENTLIVKVLPAPEGNCYTAWRSSVVFNCNYGWHYVNLPAVGIWRSVRIVETGRVSMEKPFVSALNAQNASKGIVDLYTELKGLKEGIEGKLLGIIEPDNFDGDKWEFAYNISSYETIKKVHLRFRIPDFKLWWPLDIGEQNLYKLSIVFIPEEGSESIVSTTTFGIRSIEMQPVGEPFSNEYNWKFVVNSKPIFVKGTNWCVMDAMMDFSAKRYERFLSLAEDQHIQIVRAWGGGLVETDEFYDMCDKKGIMVIQEWQTCWDSHFWQSYDAFEETVRLNTIRIRNHPSLVMWAGGNESSTPYGKVIDMMERYSIELDGTRPFHRGDGFGNMHVHIIWESSSERKSIEHYVTMDNVMLNEFGLASLPNMESIIKYLPERELSMWPQPSGGSFYSHLPVFNERNEMNLLIAYSEEFINTDSLENFVVGTQIAQTTALRHKMERARTRWPMEAGVMSYKLNDVYIGVSWASVDWYGVPKMAHYFTQDAYSPLHACLIFHNLDNYGKEISFPIYLLDDSDSLSGKAWKVNVRAYNSSLHQLKAREFEGYGSINVNRDLSVFTLNSNETKSTPLFLVCEVLVDGKQVDRTFYWCNYKTSKGCMFRLPKTAISHVADDKTITIKNTGNVPAVAVYIECSNASEVFRVEDNYFWLEAGEERTLAVNMSSQVKVKGWNLK